MYYSHRDRPATESSGEILRIAREVKQTGATVMRGGAFKPRTSRYDFQGLGKVGQERNVSVADGLIRNTILGTKRVFRKKLCYDPNLF